MVFGWEENDAQGNDGESFYCTSSLKEDSYLTLPGIFLEGLRTTLIIMFTHL